MASQLPRVFISFDYDNDASLKVLLAGQAKKPDTPFTIADWSVKEAIAGDWKTKVRTRIKSCNQVIVICGRHTNTASGVDVEVRIAQEEGIPYFLLNGYSGASCVKPKAAKSTDKIYNWTWENLKLLIHGNR